MEVSVPQLDRLHDGQIGEMIAACLTARRKAGDARDSGARGV